MAHMTISLDICGTRLTMTYYDNLECILLAAPVFAQLVEFA